MFILLQYADEPEGGGSEEQGVLRGSDRLGSQHLVAGNQQEYPGVDAAGKESSKCSFLSLLSSDPRFPLSLWVHVSGRLPQTHKDRKQFCRAVHRIRLGHLLFVHFGTAGQELETGPKCTCAFALASF